MGAEGTAIEEILEAGSLARLLRDGEIDDTISKLIEQNGQAVLEPRVDGSSLLHSLAIHGCYEAVRVLWAKGAKTSILQSDESTILHSIVRTMDSSQDLNRSRMLSLVLDGRNSVSVNQKNIKGWTALKLAARKGLERCVEILLNHGADPNIPDNESYLPLHNAVGNQDVVKLLINPTININSKTQEEETPLYLAVDHGSVDCAFILLEHGADPNIANKEGITPLFLAARGGKVSLVRELLRKKADPNCRGAAQLIAPLHWAAHKENVDIALLLIEYGGDIQLKDKEGRTPLTLASPDLSAKMIEQAKHRNPQLELPPPTKEVTMSAVEKAMAACCGGNVSALLALLQSGISVNHVCEQRTNSTMLHMAAYCGQFAIVASLLSNSADWKLQDKDGDTVLHFACMKEATNGNHDATLKFLLSMPAVSLINAQNARGDTPLLVAIRCQFTSRAKLLLLHGADSTVKNNKNELPLHRACCSDKNIEVVLYLCDLLSDLNIQDGDGWTALMYACRSHCRAIVKYLLQRGVDPNIQQSSGFTALHLATQENLPDICQVLLKYGANPNIVGGDQLVTPLHIAAHKGFKEICQILVEHGADFTIEDSDKDTPLSLAEDNEVKKIIIAAHGFCCTRARSNSQTTPTNCHGVVAHPFLHCSMEKRSSKECENEQVLMDVCRLQADIQYKDETIEKLVCDLKRLKNENERCESRIWGLEEDLRQKEFASQMSGLSLEEQTCNKRWWMIDMNDFKKSEKQLNISSESFLRFFDVHLGVYRMMDVAIKQVCGGDKWDSDVTKTFLIEVEQLSHLQCPNIIQFLGAFTKPLDGIYGLIMEYSPHGNLHDILHVHQIRLERLEKLKIVRDIANGMCYLHTFPVLHRSLQPRNVLLGENLNAKLSDFGFYETKVQSNYYVHLRKQCKGKNTKKPLYLAPEVIERNEYSIASDVYAFGMTLYEIATETRPFSDMDPSQSLCVWVMKLIMGSRPPLPDFLQTDCQAFIQSCWHGDPSARPNFNEILAHLVEQIPKEQEKVRQEREQLNEQERQQLSEEVQNSN